MIDSFKKLFILLSTYSSRNSLFFIFALSIFSALIETISVALFFPFISILIAPHAIMHFQLFSKVFSLFLQLNPNYFILLFGSIVLITITLGNFFSAFALWQINRFAFQSEHKLSSALLKKYLSKSYLYFLSHNSTLLAKMILHEARKTIDEGLNLILRIAGKIISVFVIVLFLLICNPLLAIIISATIGTLYGIFIIAFRSYLSKQAILGNQSGTLKFKTASEALSAIQEVKLMNLAEFMIKKYDEPSKHFSMTRAITLSITEMPRFLLDIVLFGGILLYMLIILYTHNTKLDSLIPTLGMFAYAAARIIPSISYIYRSAGLVKFSKPAIDALYNDFFDGEPVAPHNQNAKQILFRDKLILEDIEFRYPETHPILQHICFEIPAYSCVGLIGKTGVGKTTLSKILLGLLNPTSGRIIVDDIILGEQNIANWQALIGYVSQSVYLLDDSIANNIAFGIENEAIDWKQLEKVAKIAEIHDFITQDLSEKYHTIIGERGVRLSGGQQQRLGIARALYRTPSVLIFDEATNALDHATENNILRNIRTLTDKLTIIMITHRLATLAICDHIVELTPTGIKPFHTHTHTHIRIPTLEMA